MNEAFFSYDFPSFVFYKFESTYICLLKLSLYPFLMPQRILSFHSLLGYTHYLHTEEGLYGGAAGSDLVYYSKSVRFF